MAMQSYRLKVVNGLLIAASEVIRLDEGDSIAYIIYNENLGFCFCILNTRSLEKMWDIQVNNYYTFLDLKIGCLEMVSGKKIILMETTATSSCVKIEKNMMKEFFISTFLMDLISAPYPQELMNVKNMKKYAFVSYEGKVTDVKRAYGVYELDSKVILFTTFNVSRSKMSIIIKGTRLLVSNAHFLNIQEKYFLVCCGLSCVKIFPSATLKEEDNFVVRLVLRNSLNVFDLLWIENLYETLQRKFITLIPHEAISFESNEELSQNLINFFRNSKDNKLFLRDFSMIHEFYNQPHTCLPFSKSQLSLDCVIFDIVEILMKAKGKIAWIDIGKQWSFFAAEDFSMVMIGLLYLSDENQLLIKDNSICLPVLLSEKCIDCSHDESILMQFKTPDTTLIVAIKDYDIVFENIKFENKSQDDLVYLRTSACCIIMLTSFYPIKKHSLSQDFKQHLNIKDDGVFDSMLSVSSDLSSETNSCLFEQNFLILSRLRLINNKHQESSRVLLQYLPESHGSKNDSIYSANNSFNFYETEDDFEFSNLISKMSNLFLDNEPKLLSLNFQKKDMAKFLFPGHIYSMDKADICVKQNTLFKSETQENIILSMTLKAEAEIFHKSQCWESWDFSLCSKVFAIQEILLKKCIPRNSFIRAVLIDKFLKEDFRLKNSCKSEKQQGYILCLQLRDVESIDTIYAYLSSFPLSTVGLLPGVLLELYGFQCICSQKGYLYLRPLSTFSIEIKNPLKEKCDTTSNKDVFLENKFYFEVSSLQKRLKNLCFILKVVSAELFASCVKCQSYFTKKCDCLAVVEIKANVSALIDDGQIQLMCHFHDDEAQKILAVNSKEWEGLKTFVKLTHQPLKFNDKMNLKDLNYLPVLNQVFCTYCLSRSSCRQMLIEYYVLPCSAPTTETFYFAKCVFASDLNVTEYLLENYVKLKKFKNF